MVNLLIKLKAFLSDFKGISTTYRFVGRQKVEIDYDDLVLLLNEEEPNVKKMSDSIKKQLEEKGKQDWYLISCFINFHNIFLI